jgi:DNA polymerase-4
MEVDRLAASTAERLASGRHSGRTITLKVRLHDFSTLSRSRTLPAPTDQLAVIRREARRLLEGVDVTNGIRLLGVSVSGISDTVQHELPLAADEPAAASASAVDEVEVVEPARTTGYAPGVDVEHDEFGRGWVQGSGVGRVTVRFETWATGPGAVRTLPLDDPALHVVEPLPFPGEAAAARG